APPAAGGWTIERATPFVSDSAPEQFVASLRSPPQPEWRLVGGVMTTMLDRFAPPGANATGLAADATGLAWPATRMGEALGTLARVSGLAVGPPLLDGPRPESIGRWMESAAAWLGLEVEPVETPYPEARRLVTSAGPALFQLPGQTEPRFLVVLRGGR